MKLSKVSLGVKGKVKVDVVDHRGATVQKGRWQKNLLLNRGLNAMADNPICDIFRYCARGTGTTPTTEAVAGSNTYIQSGTTVTRSAGTRDFSGGDVGKLIRTAGGSEAAITTFTDATHVEVDRSQSFSAQAITIYAVDQTALATEDGRTGTCSLVSGDNSTETTGAVRTFQRTFVFDAQEANTEAVTGTYSKSGTTVTRASGARNFTTADVGKYLEFVTAGIQAKITGYTSATVVTVDVSGTVSAQAIKLHGFTEYTEVGFSDSGNEADPVNIRVLLGSAARVYAPNLVNPGQQLKVTYQLELSVSPSTVQSGSASITDPDSAMSGNKTGTYSVENFLTSLVLANGDTDASHALLDPYFGGHAALSPVGTALSALVGVMRSSGAGVVSLTPNSYTSGSHSRTATAVFGINDAIAANHRSLMLYDPDSGTGAFTFLFNGVQNKDGNHTLTVRFQKSWGRDLS